MEWKVISIYPSCEINRDGVIRRIKNQHVKKTYLKDNVLRIDLHRTIRNVSVARLVYNAFSDTAVPAGFKVKHKDGNPYNVSFDNLRLKLGYGMKPTEQQLEIFNNEAYRIVKWYLIEVKKMKPYEEYWGGLTFDDAIQDCVMAIYETLPMFENKSKFITWCVAVIKKRHVIDKYFYEPDMKLCEGIL